jgi:hypothetical protein
VLHRHRFYLLRRFDDLGLIVCSSTRLEDVPCADSFSVEDTIVVSAMLRTNACLWLARADDARSMLHLPAFFVATCVSLRYASLDVSLLPWKRSLSMLI